MEGELYTMHHSISVRLSLAFLPTVQPCQLSLAVRQREVETALLKHPLKDPHLKFCSVRILAVLFFFKFSKEKETCLNLLVHSSLMEQARFKK